ncbi:unnamed protein product [Mytilus coruscus]|uniref:Uncharacterized protein n=1 Tax=Mytilus coruscus TaxID=42192 RepID=A0A6J8DXR1_MYTCO|nr:unnamed protein product [Mytilus coruscus]
MNVTGKTNAGFDPGSVNMQQAQLGRSLNMFGGAKGGDPNKMDASSLMGGSSGMMSGANSVMSTGGSSGGITKGGGSSGGGMNLNPMNMMSGMMGGSGSGSGSGSGTNPMNAMIGGTSGTSRGANSGSASQTGGQTGGNPLDPLGAMTVNSKKAWKQTWDGSWPNTGGNKNELTTIKATPSEVDVEPPFGNTAIKEELVEAGHGNNNHYGGDTAKSWAGA